MCVVDGDRGNAVDQDEMHQLMLSEGIPRKHDIINTDAFDLKLLHSHCCQMIDCPLPLPPLEDLYTWVITYET